MTRRGRGRAGGAVRVALGAAALAAGGRLVDPAAVGCREQAAFHRVNGLPDRLGGPAWLVMQAGTIGAVPVAAAVAFASQRRRLAARLLVTGTATWLLAKGVKQVYGRPRPADLLTSARCRGPAATGLGYVSGHAGVAVALAAGAWPELGPGARAAVLAAAPLVGTARMYVGAHLPLDVLGGAALGLLVDGALDVVAPALRDRPAPRPGH